MNCQEFRSNIDGLARGALLDARTRDDAATHEESCGVCAARLTDERALTTGLRALAATMRGAETPARAESALLSAFRSRAAAASTDACAVSGTVASSTPASSSNVVPLSERAGERHWSWVKTVAVAALAAAAVALFMLVPPYLSSPAPAKESAEKRSQGAPVQTTGGAEATSEARNETALASDAQGAPSSEGAGAKGSNADVEDEPSRTLTPRRNVVRGMNVGYNSTTRGASSNSGTVVESADAREITTQFIPLVQEGGFAQSEGTHLVRVELPRSALSSFGIPINAEQSGGRVKADVLLGEDGTARAIRFVR
jgi:hypothetical protein